MHKTIIISIPDLFQRVYADSDDFDLTQALGLNESPDREPDYEAYTQWEADWLRAHDAEYAVVTWPEHVVNPRYNADAGYRGPMTLDAALAAYPGSELYGAMPEHKYTSGPWGWIREGNTWSVTPAANGLQSVARVTACGFSDATQTPETAEANARLIAAAPDLLAACKEAAQYLPDHGGTYAVCVREMCEAAIAKARGE